jgi:head-tail adaptor
MGRLAFNRRLTLEAPQRVPDGAGGYAETWVALGEIWALVDPARGREAAPDTLGLSTQRMRVTLRAVPPGRPSRPRPGMRFREAGRVLRIVAVADADAQARLLVCDTVQEEVPE